jgi:hypothetical protein
MNSSIPPTSRPHQDNNKAHEELVTITEKINLTKNQYKVLNIICNTYEESVSQYLQEALVEAMRFDIDEGNFSEVLLQKVTDKKEENKINGEKSNNSSSSSSVTGSVANDLGNDFQF